MPRLQSPAIDFTTSNLAEYLKENLNNSYPERIVVRSTRCFDAVSVPISDFPLLKVYRLNDAYRRGTIHCESTAVITYSLSFPEVEQLPGILKWAADSINYFLLQYELDTRSILPVSNKFGYRAEYRLMANEQMNSVYPYLRFNILLRDDLVEEDGDDPLVIVNSMYN